MWFSCWASSGGRPPTNLAEERGSAIVELVAWVALIAVPLLLLGVQAVRFEWLYTASQNLAREIVREASLGVDYLAALPELTADFGLTPADFAVTVDRLEGGENLQGCTNVRARVQALVSPALTGSAAGQSAATGLLADPAAIADPAVISTQVPPAIAVMRLQQ